MNILRLAETDRFFFTTQDIAQILKISENSARVFTSRYAKRGQLVRFKKNIYILKNQITLLPVENIFRLSNLLQTPSYISLMTALSYYQITTQITRDVIESVNPIRTRGYDIPPFLFSCRKIQKELYFDFEKIGNFFIASQEKALLDTLYFVSIGKYSVDETSLDLKNISIKKLRQLSQKFPKRVQLYLKKFLGQHD